MKEGGNERKKEGRREGGNELMRERKNEGGREGMRDRKKEKREEMRKKEGRKEEERERERSIIIPAPPLSLCCVVSFRISNTHARKVLFVLFVFCLIQG